MDISKEEQRILHHLAQGGVLHVKKNDHKKVVKVECFTREGWRFEAINIKLFQKMKRRKCIASTSGKPYRITRRGLELVRAQVDNR
ncbi:YjhX family toxin [Maritalea sp. S77]|uniref:YjhX family toxin n=1 Tax=Maritalea sp. S77 TaxID=3415125 RepID=UPI003C7B6E35